MKILVHALVALSFVLVDIQYLCPSRGEFALRFENTGLCRD